MNNFNVDFIIEDLINGFELNIKIKSSDIFIS